MNIEFQYPEAFWLLLLIPLIIGIYFLYFFWKQKLVTSIGDKNLVEALFKNHSTLKERLKFILFVFAFALGCIALANPRVSDKTSIEKRAGIDVIIALDVSNSMLATDVKPDRLQNAQQLLKGMINKMPNDRIGLVLFAGHAYLQMPLSTDHDAAKLFISTAGPGAVPEQGTSISEALQKADLAFDNNSRFKTIVLVTDGETHDENALDTAKMLAKKGIMINTIGLGSTQGATIIDTASHGSKKDEAGNVIISRLNEKLLQDLAAATNGKYLHFENNDSVLNHLVLQYKDVDKKVLADVSSLHYISFYWWLVVPMLLLLILELFIPDKRKVKE